MVISVVISILTIVGILISSLLNSKKLMKVNLYWIIASFGALIILLSGLLSFKEFLSGLFSDEGMNPIKILTLFLSMTGISIYLDELGFFSYLASKILHKHKSSQIRLFVVFYVLVSVLTMFTSNDIIILTLTPFIIFFCKDIKVSPIPYLVSEFIAANTWSMIFIIGNPTNIYIASNFEISFGEYFLNMAIPTIVSGMFEFLILYIIFHKKLKEPIHQIEIENIKINKTLVSFSLIILIVVTLLLVLSSYIGGLEMYYVALGGFISLAIGSLLYYLSKKTKPVELKQTFKKLPYELIPFLISMFVIALTLNKYGITSYIHDLFGEKNTHFVYGYSSLLSANLMNNIPMSVFFSKVIEGLSGINLYRAVYASIIGSNIGAFITPLGALAGIMWMSILNKHGIKYRFIDFMKYGVIVGLPTITVCLLLLGLFVK